MTPAPEAGRTLVLIHGWGFSRTVWEPVVAALDGVPVVLAELPGHGDGPNGERLADVHEAARMLRGQLPAGMGEPVWVGWSLGGLVALAAAAQWLGPQRLALICATPRFTAGPGWTCALDAATLAAFGEELERDRAALQRRFVARCAQGGDAPAGLRRRLLALMARHPASEAGLRAGLQALASADLRAVWTGLDIPIAAWLADDDPLVPWGVAAGLAAMRPDARLRVVSGGHVSWLEDPAGLAGFLREVMA
ncbi:alpha/beta fold hydrolase [Thioalkalivibrio sp.]|uniref:alpha/beta fold hydrolase n=1 Tax=Thioalkalivibrio sp. TaxID=2093813 RepID=UPI003974E4B0